MTTMQVWFEFASNYSYPAVMRVEALARQAGVDIAWKPFLLGPVFRALGWESSPFVVQKAKGDYALNQDMPRLCAKYGLPWKPPSVFPRRALLPLRVALLASEEAWVGDFCRHMMRRHFGEDIDIDQPDIVADTLTLLGQDADDVLRRAEGEHNRQRLREQTEMAQQKGIFGAPTFLIGDAMFWGNDRLEDALVWARDSRSTE